MNNSLCMASAIGIGKNKHSQLKYMYGSLKEVKQEQEMISCLIGYFLFKYCCVFLQ